MHPIVNSFMSVLFVVGVFATANRTMATDIYVDGLHGNNGNDGSIGSPKASIQGGLNLAVSGDTVHVFPGTYSDAFDFVASGVTIRGRGEVVVETSTCYCQFRTQCAIENLSFRGSPSSMALYLQGATGIRIENCRFSNTARGMYIFQSNGATVRRCQFVNCLFGLDHESSPNSVVENCTFNANATGMRLWHAGLVVRNNSIVGSTTMGIEGTVGATGLHVLYNHFFNNFANASGIIIIDNGVFGDPLFIDSSEDVFFLRPGSPLLTGGQDGALIGAMGQAFHGSQTPAVDEPDYMLGPWGAWFDENGTGVPSSTLVDLTVNNEIYLADGVTQAHVYSPVFDTGEGFTVVRSVDYHAEEELVLPDGSRQIIDFNQATPDREVRLCVSQSSFAPHTNPTAFGNCAGGTLITAAKHVPIVPPRRARYIQLELVLRHDGD